MIDLSVPTYEVEQLYAWTRDVAQDFCPVCGEPRGFCYLICPASPDAYTLEREREDTLYSDSLSHGEWYAAAINQYERVHGVPYVN